MSRRTQSNQVGEDRQTEPAILRDAEKYTQNTNLAPAGCIKEHLLRSVLLFYLH